MTKERASLLSEVLMRKMAERIGMCGLESAIAEGLSKPPPGFNLPPPWALKASRIVGANWAKLMRTEDGPGPAQPDQIGALVGLGRTWEAFLSVPTPEIQKLEKEMPALGQLRSLVSKLSQPHFALAGAFESAIATADLSSRDRRKFAAGQHAGSAGVVDEEGELHEEPVIREQVCFFVWLFWPDLSCLRSVTDLQKFLEEFAVDGLTRKNLEKICREIGLHFKGRGRPKNPTRMRKRVGIKKSTTGLKRGDEHSRRRKKRSD